VLTDGIAQRAALMSRAIKAHQQFTGGHMDSNRIAGNWKQLKGKVKEQWGRLTDDEIDQIAGRGEQLVGTLQEKYGLAREEAERQAKEFRTRYNWQ
jgi:uncharacterized protein YjbJ (UPF0337 family)